MEKEKKVKFSIITVVKNDKTNIETTIKSLSSQNFSDYEHIIIDGNSSDGTSEVIKKAIRNQKKINYIRKKDKNLYQALNRGIKVAKGDFIGILHSGDMYAMSQKATGFDWKLRNKLTLRHAAGSYKYININGKI